MASKVVEKELNKLLSVVDEKLVVSAHKGVIYIGGEKADSARLANLKAEAQFFQESDLWKIVNETIKELAQRAMFVSGMTLEELQKGRSMLYLLDSQKRIVETFKAFVPTPVIKTAGKP